MVDFTKVVKITKIADAAEAAKAARATRTAGAGEAASQATRAPQSKPLESQFQGEGFHYTRAAEPFEKFDLSKGSGGAFEKVGVHVGTKNAAYDRYIDTGFEKVEKPTVEEFGEIAKNPLNLPGGALTRPRGFTMQLKFRNEKPLLDPKGQPWSETSLSRYLEGINMEDLGPNAEKEFIEFRKTFPEIKKADDAYRKINEKYMDAKEKLQDFENSIEGRTISREENSKWLKIRQEVNRLAVEASGAQATLKSESINVFDVFKGKKLAEQGYTHIPYFNAYEDVGKVSYIVLDPERNLRSKAAAFEAERGGIMSGAAGAAVVGGTATQEEEVQ